MNYASVVEKVYEKWAFPGVRTHNSISYIVSFSNINIPFLVHWETENKDRTKKNQVKIKCICAKFFNLIIFALFGKSIINGDTFVISNVKHN